MINYQRDKNHFSCPICSNLLMKYLEKIWQLWLDFPRSQERNFISLYNIELIAENSANFGSEWGDGVFSKGTMLTMLSLKAYTGIPKIKSAKKLPSSGIELGISSILVSCCPVWANLVTCANWEITWLLDIDDLAKINRAWLHKDKHKVSVLQAIPS